MTKYNTGSDYGSVVDNLTVLSMEDDAAHIIWGDDWRIPTKRDFDELVENCDYIWTEVNKVNGFLFTSKTNNNTLFLPAAGYRVESGLYALNEQIRYWSSDLYYTYPTCAYSVYSSGEELHTFGSPNRMVGSSIRPIKPSNP